ncbi:aminomethyl-transferring glycine dehydrogenase subunit GcvPA [bacterium]|nr:aminomethyl-transferring glycine dehydrogenase subunit GcvPA [bacterium]
MDYVPASKDDIQKMLQTIGVESFDDLLCGIPKNILKKTVNIPEGMSEYDAASLLTKTADENKNINSYSCFLGAGAYDHFIPSVVKALSAKPEFTTAYTPYQPEASQGTLQAIFEYQSMVSELTGLEVANASLYDGGSACAEAALMLINSYRGRDNLLVADTLNPFYKEIIKTYLKNLSIKLTFIPCENGTVSLNAIDKYIDNKTAGLIIQSPNFYGCIEDLKNITDKIHQASAGVAMVCNPLSLGILASPDECGVDIAVGEGQPLGIPLSYGGPYLGFIASTKKLMRRLPGRICGLTKDHSGNRCFVLTLQAREQHIRREKATSNICSNQALMALQACIYLSWLGKKGFYELAEQNLEKAHYAAEQAASIDGIELYFNKPFFNEFTLKIKNADVSQIVKKLYGRKILGGISLNNFQDNPIKDGLLVAVTEKRSKEDIDNWVTALKKIVEQTKYTGKL